MDAVRQLRPRLVKSVKSKRHKRDSASGINYKEISTTSDEDSDDRQVIRKKNNCCKRGRERPARKRSKVKATEKEKVKAARSENESPDEDIRLQLDSSSDHSSGDITVVCEVLKKPTAKLAHPKVRDYCYTAQNYDILMNQHSITEKWERRKDELLIQFILSNFKKIESCNSVYQVLQDSDSILRGVGRETLNARIKYLADASQYLYFMLICGGDKVKNESEKQTFVKRVDNLRDFIKVIVTRNVK